MKTLKDSVKKEIISNIRIDDTVLRRPTENGFAEGYLTTVKFYTTCNATSKEEATDHLLKEMTHYITSLFEDSADIGINVHSPKIGSRWCRKFYDSSMGGRNGYTVFCITNTENISDKHSPQVVYRGDNGKMWSLELSRWPGNLIPEKS